MRYIIPCVEQLDRAVQELWIENPVNSRLALILTDNVVELVCYRQCNDTIHEDSAYWTIKPKYRRHERRRVLGRYFDEKISFLRKIDLISLEEHEFIIVAHKYRNEAYHIGLKDDLIIHSIAYQYHILACDLFGRFKPSCIQSSENNPYTERVKHHFEKLGLKSHWSSFPDLLQLAQSISEERPIAEETLSEILSETLLEEIDEIKNQFQFLFSSTPNKQGKNEILENIQFQEDFMREIEKADIFPSETEYQIKAEHIQKQMKGSWKPRYDSIPFQTWRKRAQLLRREKNPFKALKKFDDLRDEKSYISEVIENAASELDAYIQLEIDRLRGK